jgi:hypothetical protein
MRIEVPFPWESPRSGVGAPAPERYVRGEPGWLGSIGWYARQVDIPPGWAGDRIWLVVGAAYWEARVWVDGQPAGHHTGGYDPFEIDITDHVRATGGAELVVRVWAPEDTDEYPHGKNTRHWYSRASGIWQSVFIEPRPATHITGIRLTPDLETGQLEARISLRAPAAGAVTARLDVSLAGELKASGQAHAGVDGGPGALRVQATVPSPAAWDIGSPTLYDVRVALREDGGRPDVIETTCGFRTISFEPLRAGGPRWLHLNGRPLYIRAVMAQGYHPEGILAYPDEATIRADVEAARRLGFNMLRLHVKLEDPRLLQWADRLGMLLWCEVPNFLTPSPDALARWEQVWQAMLERDAGHPSIALWCMFIESWGLGLNQFGFGGTLRRFDEDPTMQAWVERMYELGRGLDATRPIIENSVCEADHTVAEVNDIHLFPSGYGDLGAQARAVLDAWLAGAYPGSQHNFAPGYQQAAQPLLVSSMAGWSSVHGVETSFPLRTLVNEVRARERISGYGWVQLYDVEWEFTGLLAYDRSEKRLGFDVTRLNSDDTLVIAGPLARGTRVGQPLELEVGLAHASGRISGRASLRASLEGLDSTWQPVRRDAVATGEGGLVEGLGVTCLGGVKIASPPGPFAGNVVVEAIDGAGHVVASSLVSAAWLSSEPAGPGVPVLSLPLAGWSSGEAPPDELLVEGVPERRSGLILEYRLDLEPPAPHEASRTIALLAEAAVMEDEAKPPGTSPSWPVDVMVDGVVVARVRLPAMRADSCGVMSIVHSEGLGTYGGRLLASLGSHVWLAGRPRLVALRPSDPRRRTRVVLFGPSLGRAPSGPMLGDLERV